MLMLIAKYVCDRKSEYTNLNGRNMDKLRVNGASQG